MFVVTTHQDKKNNQLFFTAQFKIKSFSPIYLLKSILYLRKTFMFIHNFVFLPKKNKEIVVLRSPFVYKSSRLKFKFTTSTALFYIKFFITNNSGLNCILDTQISRLVSTNLVSANFYSCKKKYQNYYF